MHTVSHSAVSGSRFESLVTGTSESHQRAQVDSILNLMCLSSAISIVEAFNGSAYRAVGTNDSNRRESRTLAALRDTLLPKLISGELRVKDAERALTDTPV